MQAFLLSFDYNQYLLFSVRCVPYSVLYIVEHAQAVRTVVLVRTSKL